MTKQDAWDLWVIGVFSVSCGMCVFSFLMIFLFSLYLELFKPKSKKNMRNISEIFTEDF